MKEIRGNMDASKRQFVIIVSRWNELITKELTEGALEELKRHGAKKTVVIHVSGTWEIPPVAKKLLSSKKKPDGIIALGCIMQGQTPHAKLLGGDVGGALMGLQTDYLWNHLAEVLDGDESMFSTIPPEELDLETDFVC